MQEAVNGVEVDLRELSQMFDEELIKKVREIFRVIFCAN